MRRTNLLVLALVCFLILAAWAGPGEAAGIETPSGLTAVVISATQIDLSWTDNSGNEDGFRIERTSGSTSTEFTVSQNVTTFSDTGLNPNTTYNYRVRAYSGAEYSGFSNTAGVTTPGPPAPPSNLNAVAATSTQVDLTWTDNASNESGFSIERRTGAGEYVEISTVGANTTGFSDTGLATGTAYSYRVRAYNNAGDSGYSNTATITITALPAAPTGLTATVNSSSPSSRIDLSWNDNASNETGYRIERKTEGGSYSQISSVGANITSYSNTSLSSGTKYYYRVRAYNSAGDSAYSSEVSATTTDAVPNAPSNLTATAVSSSRIDLTWSNVSNETGYKIERKISGGSYSQIAAVGADVTSYSNTGLSSGTGYYYRVRAYNSAGDSAYSSEVSATTTGAVPEAPSNLTATAVSSSRIDLTWSNVSNETGYKIERKVSGGSYSQIATVGVNVTSYSNTGLAGGTKYYYRVRAYNSYGNSAYSNEEYATAGSSNNIPDAPGNLTATVVSSSRIDLSWDNVSNETGYKIERKVSGGSYSQIATVGVNVTSYSNTGLAGGTKYYYRVRAYNSYGNSAYSNEDYATAGSSNNIPDAPGDLDATAVSSSRIDLSWDNVSNETGYKIERKASGASYSQIATVGVNVTSYSDTGLSGGTKYYYRVRAYNSAGNSAYSNEANATTISGNIPDAPDDLTAKAVSSSRIDLSWDNVSNETGYKIERKKSGGSYSQIATVGVNVTSYSDTGLSGGTKYYYRVRAYNSHGNSAYSNEDYATTTTSQTTTSVIKLTIGNSTYYVNGKSKTMDTAAIIRENRTLLPIRYVAEAIGAEVTWDDNTRKVTVTLKDKVLELWIGLNIARVNNQFIPIDDTNSDVTPIIIPPGRTMLPLRFIAESLGSRVDWDPDLMQVTVTYPAP